MERGGVVLLAGATASGKTELAIRLAQRFGAEIVGADSRQIYRGMPIGTAAPTQEQLHAVPHHLVAFLDPHERYSAARYARDAVRAIEAIRSRGRRAVVAGGTGFYLRALAGDVTLAPQLDEALRERLAQEARLHPAPVLWEWLNARDPQRAAALDRNDAYRIVRALEIALAPRAGSRDEAAGVTLRSAGIPFVKLALDVPLDVIDARIERRAGEMLSGGLLDEAERVGAAAVAASAVGYPQVLAHLRGWSTFAELHASLVRATRRYARRQRSWLRSEPGALWVAPEAVEAVAREKLGWT
ncbi:MAG TPA: tRNA (adenosine(37)-N6)-dimethylallyltransferase MiaA [Candidatus Acidoferrales bacterium]|nr:tRNA (adenosine(37)-N6)-dimethylallyltransferase MiaA [Candidatus Acidoferrales bacterium]